MTFTQPGCRSSDVMFALHREPAPLERRIPERRGTNDAKQARRISSTALAQLGRAFRTLLCDVLGDSGGTAAFSVRCRSRG